MDKNYYQILEVDRDASPEVVEKAYKTLVKKYHPDLQQDGDKNNSEELLKKINEAYEVLSDKDKRSIYDKKLADYEQALKNEHDEMIKQKVQNQERQVYSKPQNTNMNNVNANINNINPINNTNYDNINNTKNNENTTYDDKYDKKLKNKIYREQKKILKSQRLAYENAYIHNLRNMGYNVKYKRTFSSYVKGFIFIVVLILILFILWHIPFIHNYVIDLYNNNIIVHTFGDIIIGILSIFEKGT